MPSLSRPPGDINYYTLNGQQSFNNATAQAEGRYDLAEQTWVSGTAGLSSARNGIARFAIDPWQPSGSQPIQSL